MPISPQKNWLGAAVPQAHAQSVCRLNQFSSLYYNSGHFLTSCRRHWTSSSLAQAEIQYESLAMAMTVAFF